jgi:calcium-translocating P-type ATPase
MEGISENEAQRRLKEYGLNSVPKREKKSWVFVFLGEMTNFFAVILWIASLFCFASFFLFQQAEMKTLGTAVVGVVVLNAIFAFWQSWRAERAMEALLGLLPRFAQVRRSSSWSRVPVEQLVPGDIIEIKEGDNVGSDLRLLTGEHLRVDTSHITGESLPSFRRPDPDSSEDILWAKNLVLAGTKVVSGHAWGVVFATGLRTEFGKIAQLTLAEPQKPSLLGEEMKRVSRWIAAFALALGVMFFFVGSAVGLPMSSAFLFAIGLIVANVPEGLMPTITLSLALSAQRMAKRNALVRSLAVIETLGAATVICSDKTGTLTANRLRVKEIDWLQSTTSAEAFAQVTEPSLGQRALLQSILLTHSLRTNHVDSQTNGDPIEIALVGFAQTLSDWIETPFRCAEIPFDDRRRRQSVVAEVNGTMWLFVKGAPEVIAGLCQMAVQEDGSARPIGNKKQEITDRASDFAQRGLKVLAFARKRLSVEASSAAQSPSRQQGPEVVSVNESVECQLEYLGLVALEDPLREEVPAAVAQCRKAGIRVIMITGDHPETARYIAHEAGIFSSPHSRIVLGSTVERWSNTQLQMSLEHPEIAFARVRANQKQRIVEALKSKNEIVAVTGDGVNDAPALRGAHIGIAMGQSGTDVARESADIVLLDDNFATIVAAIEEGRCTYNNIRRFMTYILSSNVPEAVPYLLFALLPIPLPLTVLQILAIDLGTDLIPALGLGAEPPDSALMQQSPRSAKEPLLNRVVLLRAFVWLGLWESAAAMACFFLVLVHGGWSWGASLEASSPLARQASTATFTAVILMQVVNVFLCRTNQVQRGRGFAGNRLILWGVVGELFFIGGFLFFPALREVLLTTPLPANFYPAILLFMFFFYLSDSLFFKRASSP